MRKHLIPHKRRALWILVLSACLFLAVSKFEPFRPRYEGLTANQWVDEWVLSGSKIRGDVVDAFHCDTVPKLLNAVSNDKIYQISQVVAVRIDVAFKLPARRQKIVDWAAVAYHRKQPVLETLAASGYSNVIVHVLLFSPMDEVKTIAETHPDNTVRIEAARALQFLTAKGTNGNILGLIQ